MNSDFEPGRIVRILRGRGKNELAVIIRVENGQMCWIADGKSKTYEKPKRKNNKHLELLDTVLDSIAESIRKENRVPSKQIRLGLWHFKNRLKNEVQ